MPSGEVQTMFRDKDPLVLHPIVCTNLEDYDKSIANYNNNLDWDVAFTPEAELIYDQITTVIGPPIRRGGRPSKRQTLCSTFKQYFLFRRIDILACYFISVLLRNIQRCGMVSTPS